MAGIESITEQIISDAKSSAQSRIARARNEAESIKAKKKALGEEEREKLIAEAQSAIDKLSENRAASGKVTFKREILKGKVELIDEVIEEAKKRIINLPEEERFNMIERFVTASSEGIDGVLYLSPRDFEAVDGNFCKKLSELTNTTVTLAGQPGNFEAGCILVCEECEYNGTLDALCEDKKDYIRDKVRAVLFPDN